MVKKLHWFIISSFIGPFVMTFFITLFILVMQFLWKYIDELVGKGLEWYIIAELLFYASAKLVNIALPLAVLLSSIMTYGNFGENYELVAMKSAGISLQKIMYPLILFTLFISVSAFIFSNNIWPVANLKMATLLYDIRQKKPTLDINEGMFYKGIEGYVIRVGKKSANGQELKDVIIYDHTQQDKNNKVIRAESGKMQLSDDERYLLLTLYNGNSYEEADNEDRKNKKPNTHPFYRTEFKESIIRFDLSGFQLKRTKDDLYKDHYEMLNLKQLQDEEDTLYADFNAKKKYFTGQLNIKYLYNRDTITPIDTTLKDISITEFYNRLDNHKKSTVINTAISLARSTKVSVEILTRDYEMRQNNINRYKLEKHRKFTLSFACLVLFFIGVPLGAIIRKGGLGMPVVVSVILFLVFHVLTITGEKLAIQNKLLPWEGMWMATAVLLPIGIFLTYKATTDSVLFDIDIYLRPFKRLFGEKK